MDIDALGRGPGGKRVATLADKLSAGEAASEADIRKAVDELFDPGAGGGGRGQVVYESLGLLCGNAGMVEVGSASGFAHSEAFVERLTFMLQQDLTHYKKMPDGTADVERSAVQFVTRLPDETLCKLLGTREAACTLQGYIAEHPNAALRAFSISRLASACTRCWAFLDSQAFVNGGFEEGGDAQRYKQRVRDWICDFFSSLIRLCDDPNDAVAAAVFEAIGAPLRGHPLCVTPVEEELRGFWGFDGVRRRARAGGARAGGTRASESVFGAHKQAFPLQDLGEIVLRSALPRVGWLIHRQTRLSRVDHSSPAIESCASLLVAALRLSTDPAGTPVKNPLLENPTSADFLGVQAKSVSGEKAGEGEGEGGGVDVMLPPKELAEEWVGGWLGQTLDKGGDGVLVEAAAWATLRLLQTVAMRPLRASFAPRVSEAFLRVLLIGQSGTPAHLWPSLHGGQQEAVVGAVVALGVAPPSATRVLAPHILAAAERIPQPRQRLALLADVFFFLLVRPARAGRSNRRGGGGGGGGKRGSGGDSTGEALGAGVVGEGGRLLGTVLEEDWFAQLVSDSPGGTRRLLFREETVAALATACAQVLAAGAVAVLSPASHGAAAMGVGTAARSYKTGATVDGTRPGGTAGNRGFDREEAVAKEGRWVDLETWLDCSLSALEACTRCVNWASPAGYVGGLAYVRLFSLVLRLLCPVTRGDGGNDDDDDNGDDRLLFERGGRAGGDLGAEGGGERLRWARERLAQVVDDLMWRLREGLPGRDIRLRLLQATCTHVRLLTVVGGDERLAEEAATELVSVLQGELGELDAQAGLATQPLRAPAVTVGGESTGDSADPGGRGVEGSHGSGGAAGIAAAAGLGTGGDQVAAGGVGEPHGGWGGDHDATPARENGGVGAGGWRGGGVDEGGMTDVMAHELVVGCLVRLALVAGGETAVEVLSVLAHEGRRARMREGLGQGAVGPMEQVVAKGIRAVDTLVIRCADENPQDSSKSSEALLLGRFLGTMDIGWQASVQPDDRALVGDGAGIFDHGAHAIPYVHRRLRRRLCGNGGGVWNEIPVGSGVSVWKGDDNDDEEDETAFEAHVWEEGSPQVQLNGGSDPVVVTAAHVVSRGGGRGRGRDRGQVRARVRIRVYNATNAKLHGFSIRLSFGKGGEAAGMGGGGRVQASVDEVLMPSAAHTLEVPVMLVDGLQDLVVHVSVVFPDAEPEPDFESEGTAELLGVETATAGKGGSGGPGTGAGGSSNFMQTQPGFDGGGGRDGGGAGGSIAVTVNAGSYIIPAEVFLGPPEQMMTAWTGFQTAWSALPYVYAFPVETCRRLAVGAGAAATAKSGMALRTVSSVRRAMAVPGVCGLGGGSSRTAAAAAAVVDCPGGNTDYAVSAAWAFEAWDGRPVLFALTAMKAPFYFPSTATPKSGKVAGRGGGGRQGQTSWSGRLEVRCGSPACLVFAQTSPGRLARFVTNGVFAPPRWDVEQQQRQHNSALGGFLPPAPTIAGDLNGAHVDWFSQTDTGVPGCGGLSASKPSSPVAVGGSITGGKVSSFVRSMKEQGYVDTTL